MINQLLLKASDIRHTRRNNLIKIVEYLHNTRQIRCLMSYLLIFIDSILGNI